MVTGDVKTLTMVRRHQTYSQLPRLEQERRELAFLVAILKIENVKKDLKDAELSSDGMKASLKDDYADCVGKILSSLF